MADFIPLTEVARGLSTASGNKYKISKELEREVVYLSTRNKTIGHVSDLIAQAYFSTWERSGDTFTLRLDRKLKLERDMKRAQQWN